MRLLTGLTCPGGFVSQQYVAGEIDTTGMEFIASYDDGTTAPVSPQSHTPTTWGDEPGDQTCVFSYTEGGVTETCEVEAEIVFRGRIGYPTPSGTVTATNTLWTEPDLTGLTFNWDIFDAEIGVQVIGTLTKTWAEIEAWNTDHPEDPLLVIVSDNAGIDENGVWRRAGTTNLTVQNGSGLGLLGYQWNPQGHGVNNISVDSTLTGVALTGSWTNSTQDVNAKRNYAGLTLTKSYSNHTDIAIELTGLGDPNPDIRFGGEIIEITPGTPVRRSAPGWTNEYTNEQPILWFNRVDGKRYDRNGTETENVATAPAITTAVNSSSLVTTKSITIDPTIAGELVPEQITEQDALIPNIFDGTQSYHNCDFFIDLETSEPLEVSEGDVFWYVMKKSDYDNDSLLAVPAQGLEALIAGLGPVVNEDGVMLWSGISSQYGGRIGTGVEFNAELTGEGTYTNENLVFVTAWAPAGATDVNVATLKPSDLTEIGKYNVAVRDPSIVVLDSITVTGSEGAAQPNDEQPDFTGYTFTFGLSNGQSIVKTGAEITANNAAGPTYFINYGGTAFHSGSDHPLWDWNNSQETVNITLGDYWESEGYLIADPAPTTSILMGTHYATSLTYTGSLTNTQYILDVNHTLGEPDSPAEPDLTGLSFTVGFADGTSEAVSTSDCQVSPYEYEAGNPSNLTSQPLTITYAGSEVGNPSVAITNNIIHRPDGQTLDSANAGYVYHDFPAELWNLIKTDSGNYYGMGQVFQGQVNEDDWLCIWLTDDAYQNDTAIDYATFGQWVSHYGIVLQSSGTVNTPGFNPGWASRLDGNDLSACYISECVDGSSQISTFETCHVLVGKATKNISGSVKKSDLDYTNGVHYIVHVGPVDYS